MQEILHFLDAVRHNNNREWFSANKNTYKHVLGKFNTITEQLIAGISSFDADIKGLTVSDCTYRIYRDTRFSHDKQPYKTHMGAYISRLGKKAPFAGYYLHLEPRATDSEGGFLGGSLLACGLYCPEPKVLRSLRDDIFALGGKYQAALSEATGFKLDTRNSLKRTPKGFPADSEWDEWLKLKEFTAMKPIDDKTLLKPNFMDLCIEEFAGVKPINDLLNRSVEYALENF